MHNKNKIEKIYFTIGEVAKMLNVAPSLIRFWESEFENIQPKKNQKGNRKFTKNDIEQIRIIHHLVKEKGYTLKGAKEIVKSNGSSLNHKLELLDALHQVRQFLMDIKKQL